MCIRDRSIADVPAYEATEIWLLADAPPDVEIITGAGQVWELVPELRLSLIHISEPTRPY